MGCVALAAERSFGCSLFDFLEPWRQLTSH